MLDAIAKNHCKVSSEEKVESDFQIIGHQNGKQWPIITYHSKSFEQPNGCMVVKEASVYKSKIIAIIKERVKLWKGATDNEKMNNRLSLYEIMLGRLYEAEEILKILETE